MKRLLVLLALGVVIVAVGIGAVIAIQLLRDDDPALLTSAPEIPTPALPATVLSTAGVTPTATRAPSSTPATGSTPGTTPTTSSTPGTTSTVAPTAAVPANSPLRFTIDSGSSAKYVVGEKLSGLQTNAVGTTNDITGDLFLTPSGLASGQTSSFKVDLRTLRTDEALRDRHVRDSTLQTNRFPFAEFVVTSITPFPANYVEGTEVSLNMTGNMNIHGVTRPLTFAVKARRAGTSLTGIADVDFKMTEFNITPPEVSLAKSEDGVHLQIVIIAKLAGG